MNSAAHEVRSKHQKEEGDVWQEGKRVASQKETEQGNNGNTKRKDVLTAAAMDYTTQPERQPRPVNLDSKTKTEIIICMQNTISPNLGQMRVCMGFGIKA